MDWLPAVAGGACATGAAVLIDGLFNGRVVQCVLGVVLALLGILLGANAP